jgi:hypothetical protein
MKRLRIILMSAATAVLVYACWYSPSLESSRTSPQGSSPSVSGAPIASSGRSIAAKRVKPPPKSGIWENIQKAADTFSKIVGPLVPLILYMLDARRRRKQVQSVASERVVSGNGHD